MLPSDYFPRQFYATFEDDEAGSLTRRLIGVANLLLGSDYPHHDSMLSPWAEKLFPAMSVTKTHGDSLQ
jgi:hypothetical protein